jgi:hypothetical protein
MRLDFDKCTNAAPLQAIVLLDVVKSTGDFMGAATLFPWAKEVCTVKTTTAPQSLAKVKIGFLETKVGNHSCDGKLLTSYKAVDKRSCKMLCIADVQKEPDAAKLQTNLELCRGYAFHRDATSGEVCKLYKGANITKVSTDKGTEAWDCYNLTEQATQYYESTPAPPTKDDLKKAVDALPKLNLNTATKAKSASIVTMFNYNNTCFAPFNVITLQDFQYNTVAVSVKASEWKEFLDTIPAPVKAGRLLADAVSAKATVDASQVFVDRAAYGPAGTTMSVVTAESAAGPAVTTPEPACKPVTAPASNGLIVGLVNIILGLGCLATFVIGGFGCMNAQERIKAHIAAAQKMPPPAE